MTRKMHILGLALLALCALSALMTASASAVLTFELALWLLDGVDITSADLVLSEGEFTLTNLLNGAAILCSGFGEGTVEPESLGLVTMVYDLSSNLIEELSGAGVSCTSDAICAANTAKEWPIGLPWLTEVEQDNDGTFWVLTFGAGTHFECTVLGIKVEELCEIAEGEIELLNVATGVEAMGTVSQEATCNGTINEGSTTLAPGNITTAVGGGTLSVSLP